MNDKISCELAVLDECGTAAHVSVALPAQPRAPSLDAHRRKRHAALLASAAGIGLLSGVQSAQSETYTWNGTQSAAWSNSANWTPAGIPTAGDDVIIGQTGALVVGEQAAGTLQLIVGGLTVDPAGQLTFQFVDLKVQSGNVGSLTNYGVVAGSVGNNEGSVKNFGAWDGDVQDNSNQIRNQGSWTGDVRNNNSYIDNDLNSTWTGDVWENNGDIFNLGGSTWTGDIFSNSGYIDSYDLGDTWNGNIQSNAGTIYNGGIWNGDVWDNTGSIGNYYSESTWNGDVLDNNGEIFNAGIWNGSLINSDTINNISDGVWTGAVVNNDGTINNDEANWNGDVLGNSGDIFNAGVWNGSLTNLGGINNNLGGVWTGNIVGNAGTVTSNNGAIWNGDVLGNTNIINNMAGSQWNGDVVSNGGGSNTFVPIFNRGLWTGDIASNSGFISNEGGTWDGDIITNDLGVANTGTWTGAIQNNDGQITNESGGAWTGDILENNSAIFNSAGGVWAGDVIANGGGTNGLAQLVNRGLWTGDVQGNSGGLYNDGGVWNGDVLANLGDLTNTGTWTGKISGTDSQIRNRGEWGGDILGNNNAIINEIDGVWNGDVVANDGSTNTLTQIVNEGDWTGDVQSNARTIYNEMSGTWNGDVLANAGTIVTSGVWNGDFTSTGTVLAEGVINGTFTNSGQLSVTGSLTGITSLSNSGIIRMNGPGGTLAVDGDLTFSSGSTYEVGVDPTGTTSDLIMVSGTAYLNGGSVAHIGAAGTYRPESDYTILTATGGVAGAFDGVTSNFAFLNPTLIHEPNDVILRLVRNDVGFASTGTTANQQATANALDTLGLGMPLYDAITLLSSSEAPGAFDQLSGEIHASGSTALINTSSNLRSVIGKRIKSASGDELSLSLMGQAEQGGLMDLSPANQYGTWGHVYGSWGNISAATNTAALRQNEGGVLVGVDGRFDDVWHGGVFGGYGRSSINAADRSSSGSSTNYHLGIYGGAEIGAVYLNAGAAHSWHSVDTARTVAFPGFTDTLAASYNARTMQVFGEAAYRVQMNSIMLEPFAALAHVRLSSDGFTEIGGAAALTAAASKSATTFSTLGIRAATDFQLGTMNATALGMLGWRNASGDVSPTSSFAFAGSDSFAISGAPIARNAAVIELGLDIGIGNNASLGLSYDGQFGAGSHAQNANVRLAIKF